METIGQRLRRLRREKGKTQEEMSSFLQAERTTYAKYEAGKNVPPSAKIEKLAGFFDVSADYLLCRTDDRQPQQAGSDADTVRAFLKLVCKDKPEAAAIIDRADIKIDGSISLPDTDKITEAVINAQLQNFIQALKSAKPNGDGTSTATFKP